MTIIAAGVEIDVDLEHCPKYRVFMYITYVWLRFFLVCEDLLLFQYEMMMCYAKFM